MILSIDLGVNRSLTDVSQISHAERNQMSDPEGLESSFKDWDGPS